MVLTVTTIYHPCIPFDTVLQGDFVISCPAEVWMHQYVPLIPECWTNGAHVFSNYCMHVIS